MIYGDEGGMWHDGWGGGWMLMAIGMVLVWAVIVTAVVLAVRYLTANRTTPPTSPGQSFIRAEDLLAERYARGELDDEEYRRRLALLREHRGDW